MTLFEQRERPGEQQLDILFKSRSPDKEPVGD
jgi:hypothetical protein